MFTVQLPPAFTSPQLLVWPYFADDIDACMKVTREAVLLVKVTGCVRVVAKLPSAVALCVTPLVGVEGVVDAVDVEPEERLTTCGLLGALLVTVKVPVSEPLLVG